MSGFLSARGFGRRPADFLGLALLALLSGCAARPRLILYQLDPLERLNKVSLDRLVWQNALPPEQELSSTLITRSDLTSAHLIQVRTSEPKHVHEQHDLVVFLQQGTGMMFLGKEVFRLDAGAVIFIPRGTAHYFVNQGPQPAVAVGIFSPPYDGKDMLLK